MNPKSQTGRFFEDFRLGAALAHAGPRTLSVADAAINKALTGTRFATYCSRSFAQSIGYPDTPIDEFLVFNVVFGQSVPDVSMRATATLGYFDLRFVRPVFPGDTLRSESLVLGLDPGPDDQTGVVHVRTTGRNQHGEIVISYIRSVAVFRREAGSSVEYAPLQLPVDVVPGELPIPAYVRMDGYDAAQAGSPFLWEDYEPGERIDHVFGMTFEEADQMMSARLYQNTSPPHYDACLTRNSRFGRRVVFVGHVAATARALSINGVSNAFCVAAVNRAKHLKPTFPDDTVYAWSEVVECAEIPDRADIGALRLRTFAVRDRSCEGFPGPAGPGAYEDAVLMDLDYWVLMPRRGVVRV